MMLSFIALLAGDGSHKVVIACLGTYKRTYKLANRTYKPSKSVVSTF